MRLISSCCAVSEIDFTLSLSRSPVIDKVKITLASSFFIFFHLTLMRYGTDTHGCLTLQLWGEKNVALQARNAYSSLVTQSSTKNKPPHPYSLNFIPLMDKFSPVTL